MKCFVIHPKDEQLKQTNEQTSVDKSTPEHHFISSIKTLTANVRQMHRKRKQRTELLSRHFLNPSSLNVF